MALRNTLFALATVALVSACAPAPSIEALQAENTPPVTGATTLEGLDFPLPPGEWREVYEFTKPGVAPHAPQRFKVLASVSNGVVDRAAIVYVMRKSRFKNLWRSFQGCFEEGGPNVHHVEIAANEGGSTPTPDPRLDCWHVRSVSMGRAGGAHEAIEALHLFAQRERAYMPAVMVGARFVQKRQFDRRDYVEYLWNPDVLAPKLDGVWTPEDWRADAVSQSAAKRITVDRLIAWAKEWRPSLLGGGSS